MSPATGAAVLLQTIEPLTEADREKLAAGLATLAAEDPFLSFSEGQAAGQTVIGGVGELHLGIVVDRLLREFEVEAVVGRLRVAYKEALTRTRHGEGRFVHSVNGHELSAHVSLRVSPGEPGGGCVFDDQRPDESIPGRLVASIAGGVDDARQRGVLAGYPVDDARVELRGGSCRDVELADMAIRMAGSMAFHDAAKHAGPVLLEPIMRVEVVTPTEHAVGVMKTLANRRGQSPSGEGHGAVQVIHALVPMAEMLGYGGELRVETGGRATFSLVFERYQRAAAGEKL